MKTRLTLLSIFAICTASSVIKAQSVDTLKLATVRAAALSRDPRVREIELLTEQSRLRLKSIDTDRLPSFSTEARGQHQSDVSTIPINFPGVSIPTPPYNTFDAHLDVQQRLYDPSLAPRRAVERAQVAESQARVRTALFGLTETVNSAFYTALLAQTQVAEFETTATDLAAQLSVAEARVKAGTALPSEANTLRAELLRRRQAVEEQRSARRAALSVLADLTGGPIDSMIVLAAPDFTRDSITRASLAAIRSRPEYEQFARSREVLDNLNRAKAAQDKPRLSAFLRTGYGRPGLNALSDKFDSYWLGGLQVQWTPWNWGNTNRDRQVNALQSQIVSAEESAFTEGLQRALEQDVAAIDRLEKSLRSDEQIIALRENILKETRVRYGEAVITSAEYVDRQTDLLVARLEHALHRVQLSQAHAHLNTTLGLEVR
jgi:outer membrane protein TolC